MASDGADAARQAIRSCALKYELVINLNTALGREVPMLLAKVIATFHQRGTPSIKGPARCASSTARPKVPSALLVTPAEVIE